MKRLLILLLGALAMLPAAASHIVGGEFEIQYLHDNLYQVNLIIYFDQRNGSPGAKDINIEAAIYRKSDNALMDNIFFSGFSETPVLYTQPSCSTSDLQTSKLVYTTTVTLSPDRYDSPFGYYLTWERCCRNYAIVNIFSDDPAISSNAAGQTFYLEFPAVTKNGQKFIDSSPHLFPPLSDYACPYRKYYVNFGGIDDDGDSLVYTLVTPLSTHSIIAVPPLQPAPYPLVSYRDGFGINNIMKGNPDMRITRSGFLTVTPTVQGLFVFAVRCEEFRDGKKIGEVRRDFQLLVVDQCAHDEPPQILGKKLADATFAYDNTMNVTFSNTTADADRCIMVEVSDPDASNVVDNFTEKIHIQAIALGFDKDVSGVLPASTEATLINGSTQQFRICFPECPYLEGPFQIGIIAYDDACSLPMSDTLKVTVNIQPPANNDAHFVVPVADVTETVNEGDVRTWDLDGVDLDGDMLVFGVIADFRLEDVGMKVVQVKNVAGEYQAQLQWDTHCDVYDFTHGTDFKITFTLEDLDHCNFNHPDKRVFNLKVKLPGNLDPIIDSDLTANPAERRVLGLTRKVNETLSFNVFGKDGDNDFIVLSGKGVGFDMADYNIEFPGSNGRGQISSLFKWNIFCDKINLGVKDTFLFEFLVVDNANKCRFYKADTLDVSVIVEPPDNNQPTLLVNNLNQQIQFVNNAMTVELGQQITLGLVGTDPDNAPQPDMLTIDLIKAEGNVPPTGYIFAEGTGRGSAETTFSWKPECDIFLDGVYENHYTFTFNVTDDRCFNTKGDTVAVDITIKDVEHDSRDFLPPNFITPNGDNYNDFFAMVRLDESTGQLVNILPRDNCVGVFEGIAIYNRWGRQVFESTSRDFRWYADSEAAGMYYYLLKYSNKEYKGVITLSFYDHQSNNR
ncbi:C-terminal domain of CHU protein family protein [Chryseolinea serpens]|uniref:C-terminal domain of CHU protein family protein n=1 Tax=Chryseolinea serpens TaxID=947013 RepID=A0A1M5N2F2_9BACT|nr:gliding motility-associated C-terminal domain-containing protein [Chryseolinea serpens]SHG83748.1 C-terminal domain of CHU protein family protein [Chryseolinea serpens]